MDEPVTEEGRLGDGYVLGDVDGLRAQRVGARGAVGDELHVDAGGLRLVTPVAVVALERGAERAVHLRQGEGSGGVPGGVHPAALVRALGQDRERGVGQALGQQRVGGPGGYPYGPGVRRGDVETGVAEDPGLGGRLLGGAQRARDIGGPDLLAVLEGGVAQREGPGAVVVALPGGGERGLGVAVPVEGGEALDNGEAAEGDGVVAVRGHGLGGREGHDDPEPLPVRGAARAVR